jgi:hypothetical protein
MVVHVKSILRRALRIVLGQLDAMKTEVICSMSASPLQRSPGMCRSSVAVGSKKMVRYGRPAGKRAALSPKTREKAVADQDDVGWPFGMLREYSLLGVDAVDQRRPTD